MAILAVAWTVQTVKLNIDGTSTPVEPAQDPTLSKQATTARAAANLHSLKNIAEWNVFGLPAPIIVASNYETLPETTLSLTLHGTFTSTSDNISSILVSVDNKEARRVYQQDEISPGVVLHWVGERDVIILRGSILETLHLYEPIVHASLPRRHRLSDVSTLTTPVALATTND